MTSPLIADLGKLLPELALVGTIIALLIADLLVNTTAARRRGLMGLASAGLLIAGIFALAQSGEAAQSVFFGQLAVDPMGSFFKVLFVFVAGATMFTSALSRELPDRQMGEYYTLLVAITLGMFLMGAANDLLTMYLGVELVSIVSFAMAGYRLHDARSSEAALKYVIYGGAASGMMLFGISLLYGLAGTTELSGMQTRLLALTSEAAASGAHAPLILVVSVVLIFAGIGFKVSAVPFHMWAPDVYEGAPTPFSGFLSVGPKAAGFALLIRFFLCAFVPPEVGDAAARGFATDVLGMMTVPAGMPVAALLGVVAALTMGVGNLAALPQTNVKRMLAYSSIAHAGYLLMGLVVLSESALHAIIFYLVIYYLMNIGAFTVCQVVRDRTGGETLDHFSGVGNKDPWLGVCMTFFMFSLTGLPPLAGFIAKFYLFASVIERGGFWYVMLAIWAVLNSVVSLYYYVRVVRAMFIAEADNPSSEFRTGLGYTSIITALAVPTLLLCFYWTPLRRAVHGSVAIYRAPPSTVGALHTPRSSADALRTASMGGATAATASPHSPHPAGKPVAKP